MKAISENEKIEKNYVSGILINADTDSEFDRISNMKDKYLREVGFESIDECVVLSDEFKMLIFFINFIQKCNPEVLFSYDKDKGSLFHIAFRASKYNLQFYNLVSRKPTKLDFFTKFILKSSDIILIAPIQNQENSSLLKQTTELIITETKNSKKIARRKGRTLPLGKFSGRGRITGMVIIDTWKHIRHDMKIKSYSLPLI